MQETSVSDPVFTLTSGPVDAYPAVLRALSRTVLYDYDPAFLACYERVNEKAREALRSAIPPVILHGEPVLGLEAAAASLLARDDVVLNLASGVYGKGFGYWAKRYCAELVEIETAYNEAIDPAEVAAAFEKRPDIKVVSVCHHDTPSGTINPIDEIGRIVAARGGYLIVDAVSSFGGMDVHPDACRADIFVTRPNKCLGCPPGLTLMGVSARAWEKMKANPDAPRASILSILDWEHAWRHDQPFPFTPSVAEINGFEAALDLYLAEGPENVWARHALTAAACRAGVTAMGLALWPARRSPRRRRRRCAYRAASTMRRCATQCAPATASSSPQAVAKRSASSCVSAIWGRRLGRSMPCWPSPRSAARSLPSAIRPTSALARRRQ